MACRIAAKKLPAGSRTSRILAVTSGYLAITKNIDVVDLELH
jgi:hypothetical protein